MTPYIILIVFVFLWRGVTLTAENDKRGNSYFLAGVFIYLYIFCVIRSFDVGRDIPGYIREYNQAANLLWSNWKLGHFEAGYIFLMKICNLVGLSARGFFYVVYLIILLPIWYLLKNESPRPFISVLVFVCFQFFIFDLTGLRQAMASSLCILAYMIAQRPGNKYILLFAATVFCAYLLHKSAMAFAIAFFILRLPLNKKTIIIFISIAVACAVLNVAGVGVILSYFGNTHYEYSNNENQHLGAALVFIILFAVLGIILSRDTSISKKTQELVSMATLLTMTGVCAMFLVNGSVLLRATMYFYFPIILIPAYMQSTSFYGLGRFIKIALMAVLLWNFFTAEVNSFDVMPYEIGRDQQIFK